MKEIYHMIQKEAERRNGVIRTSEIEEQGISRSYLKDMVNTGRLVRESKGIYIIPDDAPDEYFLIQKRSEKLIYSYGTALFFHGLSDRVPTIIDATFPQGYNASRLKKAYPMLRIHYVQSKVLEVGVCEINTPQGYKVRTYDSERCICDLIKDKEKVDKQLYTQALREYFRGNFFARKILKTAKLIGVEKEVKTYMEVLQG